MDAIRNGLGVPAVALFCKVHRTGSKLLAVGLFRQKLHAAVPPDFSALFAIL
jgi:hypothetical protein